MNLFEQDFAVKTQKEAVLSHLKSFGKITSWEAIKEYGATRLSGIIYTLRKEGYEIISEDTTNKNRFGNPVTFSTYKLKT
jgi:hypothetical protein